MGEGDPRPHLLLFGVLASVVAVGCSDGVDAGRQLYMKHGCAVCHGASGRGDGPNAARYAVPPTDFSKVDQYRSGSSVNDIAMTIRFGPAVPGPMPPFAHISEEDARLLAAWIVSLQGTDGASGAPAEQITVRDAWVRESSAIRTVSAGYLTIDNRAANDRALVGVAVEGARRAELHTVLQDGDAVMRRVESLTIPAQSAVELAPGGTHVMLFDVNPPLVAGEAATMTLTFDNKQQEIVRAVVRPLAAMSVR
jgi:copper(I)-binding protein